MVFADEATGLPSVQADFSPFADRTIDPNINTRENRASEIVQYSAPALLAGMADTFGTSLGLLEEGELLAGVQDSFENFGDFYARNAEAVKVASDLTGMFIPGMAAMKIFRAGSFLQRAVTGGKRSSFLNSVFTSGQNYDSVLRGVRARDLFLAQSGTLNFADDAVRQGLVRQALTTKLADTVKETLAFEAGVYATMNTSDVLYPDEMSTVELLALNAVFPGAFAIGEGMFLNRLVRASAQRPELADIAKNVRNPLNVPLDQIISRPGQRDLDLTVLGLSRVTANQASQEATEPIAASTLNAQALAYRAEIQQKSSLLLADSVLPGLTKSERLDKKSPQVRTIVKGIEDDPTVMLGAFDAQTFPATGVLNEAKIKTPLLEKRRGAIKKIKRAGAAKGLTQAQVDEISKLQREIDTIESAQFQVLEIDGTLSIAGDRKPIFQDSPTPIETFRPTAETGDFRNFFTTTKPPAGKGQQIAFTEDGILQLPRVQGKDVADRFNKLSIYNTTAVWGVVQEAMEKFKPGKGTVQLSKDDHFTRIDYALGLLDKHGDNVVRDIAMPRGIKNTNDLQFLSLNKKFEAFVKRREEIDKFAGSKLASPEVVMNFNDLTRMLNLPRMATEEPHPVFKVFENLYQQGDRTFEEARLFTFDQFKRLTQEEAFFPEITSFMNKDMAMMGRMMAQDTTRSPVLLTKRPVDRDLFNRDMLVQRAAQMRAETIQLFTQAEAAGANLVATLFKELSSKPELVRQAQKVDRLIEGTQKGTGLIGTQQRARGETATIQSAQMVEELTDKAFRIETAKLLDPHTRVWTQLRAPANRAQLTSFNTYVNARRQGWDLEPDVAQIEGGNIQFKLAVTDRNAERFERLFGQEMPKGAMMPGPTPLKGGQRQYQPLSITPMAFEAAQSFSSLGETALKNTNHIKKIFGRGATTYKPWWVPSKNLARENTVFIVDPATERTVNIVGGSNPAEAVKLAQREIAERNQDGLIYVTQEEMGKYFSLRDDAFERFADFTDPLNQTGPSKGRATTIGLVEDNIKVLNDMVDTIERQFESILRRGRIAYFEPQISYAKRLHSSFKPANSKEGQSIWQQYIAALFGNPTLNPNDIVGKIYYAAESAMDDVLEVTWNKTLNSAGLKPRTPSHGDVKRFNALDQQLGEFNPFTDAFDFVERTLDVKTPPRLKPMFAGLNKLTSLLTLRLLEVGHSVLTLTSLAATMPGVIKALRRASSFDENVEDYAARIGAFGLRLDDNNAMFHPMRAIISGTNFMFSPEGRKVWDAAANKGYMQQNVSEIFKTLTAPKEGYAAALFTKATDMMSVLSDKSEQIARGISFMTGYNIAKRGLGIANDDAAFAFAHRFANDTIGNYAPNNRPRIFQGAVGMPLGLFMTFMWNYYERIFSYIGNRQTRALAVQFATQAAVFGGQTVPGFQQFSDFFASNYDGTVSIVDGLDRRFGTEATEWFLYGTISNLPKLVGADDGIALSTRGDVNFRNIPTIFTFQDTPVFAMIRDGVNALQKGFEMVRERGGFSVQQTAEIMQNYSTSRFFRNLGYLTTGVVTDRRGQRVGDRDQIQDILQLDVQNGLGLSASLMGLRTIDENRRIENAYRIRSGEISRQARVRQLRDRLRSDIRAGLTEEDVNEAVASYVKYGGNPEGFSRFLLQQTLAAQVNKDQKKLIEIIGAGDRRGTDIRRLLSTIGTGTPNDPEYQR